MFLRIVWVFWMTALSLRAGEDLVVRVGFFPNITHAQALVASSMSREGKGWFESRLGQPVRLEWLVYQAGSSAMEGLFTKAIDWSYVGPSPVVNAHIRANGKDVRVAAGSMRGGEALVVRGDAIQTPAEFLGKTVATPQLGNTQDVECRAWLKNHGFRVTLTGGDVKVIPTANPDMLPLFQQGKIDAAWTVEPWVTRLVNEAGGRVFHANPEGLTTVLSARVGFLESHPELARAFVQAHRELTTWIVQHPDEAQSRIQQELSRITRREISLDLVRTCWSRLKPDSSITLAPFENFVSHAREVGFLRGRTSLEHLLWEVAP